MKTSPAAPTAHADRLLADVTELLGRQLPPGYERALRTVPRHLFLPGRLWLRDGEGGYRLCDRSTDPDGWLTAAYLDIPLVTQFTDGLPSSSASMPSMVLRTLLLAGLDGGGAGAGRVLELGTGTGFNAALLCAFLGEGVVSTVELDPVLAAQGERNLEAAGFAPAVSCGDAAEGWPPGAPYERVIATFSVDRVPPAWLEQTTAGGRIVTPWTSAWCRYGTLELTTGRDGTAHGRFHAFASFMPMQRPRSCQGTGPAAPGHAQHRGVTSLSPWRVAGGDLDAEFHLGLTVPGASFAWDTSGEYAPTRLHIADEESPSWAAVDYDGRSADRFTVTQAGPRLLWDEITTGYTCWEMLERPRIGQYRLSVNMAGDHTVTVETGRGTSEIANPTWRACIT
ncbi:protein-L-isoaspartate O-methyltransferase family protein [Streptomyces olivoreticuli]|uniref:protein-L-isoaspartate O-methyltransferase family protein n=1 Tax=Streptomyces olivoreticuli TaxID=68246 RepID=UPI001F0862AC|nr:methyltransferase [Streptomyces olivoreticuli]